jgi:hypothetical protein
MSLTIAWLLDRPELISHVRRNVEATLYLLDPNGEVETVHSRRQDQTHIRDIWPYLLQYRELALLDGNGQFARGQAPGTSGAMGCTWGTLPAT